MKGVNLDGADIIFYMEMPKSWSQKKRIEMLGEPHRQKPDLDNLIKALGDALYGDDSGIASIKAAKVWSCTPGITVVERTQ
jgi:Holliday junction resolvase RusA-like endonuclease